MTATKTSCTIFSLCTLSSFLEYLFITETEMKTALLFHFLLFIVALTIVFMVHLDILKPRRAGD